MKKLLSILLALVMMFSLTVPAFADGLSPEEAIDAIGGADGPTVIITNEPTDIPAPDDYYDDDYTSWAKEYWAQLCEKFPEETAQFLKELPAWFAEHYPEEESFEAYCEYYNYVEEVYVEFYDYWLWDHEQEQAKNDFITSHGGTPGQINVMVNGKCVKFLDAAPEVAEGRTMVPVRAITEALGGEVLYGDREGLVRLYMDEYVIFITIGSTTVEITPRGTDTGKENRSIEMDCAPYAKGGRTYVPVRFISEALGYDVQWDDYYQTVVITDLTALAGQIDKDFTIYNKLAARSALTGKTQKSVGSATADVTLFDTLNGDKTGKGTCSYDLAASTAGASGKLEYDFTELWSLIEGYIPMPLDLAGEEEYTQALELVKSLMKGSLDVRVDLEKGKVYLSMPGLFEAMGDYLEEAGVQIPKDAWLSTSLTGDAEMDELITMMSQTLTVGKLLTAIGGSASVSGNYSARNYDSILEAAGMFGKLYGDGKFKRQGNADVLTLTKEDLAEILEPLVGQDGYTGQDLDALSKFDFTLTVKDNGDVDVDYQARVALAGSEVNLGDFMDVSVKGSTRDGKTEETMEVHIKNVLKATVTLQETLTETDETPETAPPKDALVLPMDGTLPGGTITSPDGPTQIQP